MRRAEDTHSSQALALPVSLISNEDAACGATRRNHRWHTKKLAYRAARTFHRKHQSPFTHTSTRCRIDGAKTRSEKISRLPIYPARSNRKIRDWFSRSLAFKLEAGRYTSSEEESRIGPDPAPQEVRSVKPESLVRQRFPRTLILL